MKEAVAILVLVMGLVSPVAGENQNVYLLSKRQIVNSTHTLVVLFHDPAITTMAECQREIQRGNRGQWRYYRHRFPRPAGYSERKDYLCIETPHKVDSWYDRAPYDFVYQIDIRSTNPVIRKMPSLAECLNDLRKSVRDEVRLFFCGKLSQTVSR